MKYYVFTGSTGTQKAITDDRNGTKLPKRDFGTWVYEREIDLDPSDPPRIGLDSKKATENIQRDGYHIWPEKE